MIAQAVPYAGSRQRNLVVSLGQFLCIMSAADQRIVPGLSQAGLEQVQDHLRVLGIVLAPGVVHRLPHSSQSQGWNQPQLETLSMKKVCQRPMVVAGSLEPDHGARPESAQILSQALVVFQHVRYPKVPASS